MLAALLSVPKTDVENDFKCNISVTGTGETQLYGIKGRICRYSTVIRKGFDSECCMDNKGNNLVFCFTNVMALKGSSSCYNNVVSGQEPKIFEEGPKFVCHCSFARSWRPCKDHVADETEQMQRKTNKSGTLGKEEIHEEPIPPYLLGL